MTDDCTCAKCNTKRNRIAAFAGIRRAVCMARDLERTANTPVVTRNAAVVMLMQSDAIRCAIRAAIGSDKT